MKDTKGLTPSQALNLAIWGNSGGESGLVKNADGTRYDPVLKKNVQVTGQQLANMEAASRSIRNAGYTPYEARDLSYNYKDVNPVSILNQNKSNPSYISASSVNITPKTSNLSPSVVSAYTTPSSPSTPTSALNATTATGDNQISYTAKPVSELMSKYISAGQGSTFVGEEEENPQFRGSPRLL